MSAETISSLAALFMAAAAIYIAWRKTPAESRNLDSNAAKQYEEAAASTIKRAAESEKRYEERIDSLEKRVDDLECLLETANKRIQELEDENAAYKNWAERLVFQVRALDEEPVKLRIKGKLP